MADLSSLLPNAQSFRAFVVRLSSWRFLVIAATLHFLALLALGGVVLFHQSPEKADFDDTAGALVVPTTPAALPASDVLQPMQSLSDVNLNTAIPSAPALKAITAAPLARTSFELPSAPALSPNASRVLTPDAAGGAGASLAPGATQASAALDPATAKAMKDFTNSWRAPGDSGRGQGKDRAFKFTAYLARYRGGDWNSTVQADRNGRMSQGSLFNLLYLVKKWSSDKLDAEPQPMALDLAKDDLFNVRPPFIFFTGHRDFKLSDKEVENLNKYIHLGGAIWGDSSLPGARSRFDVAFRREMKRVLPDQNIPWETLPANHPLYTKAYYPDIKEPPPGMNYFQEPVYALRLYGEIAVLYTANDYGDMWQIGLTEKGEYDTRRDDHDRFVALNRGMFERRDIYFRNLDPQPLANSYRFGTNIIVHLLTRWEDKLRNVPAGQ